jgi:hypothetical protein
MAVVRELFDGVQGMEMFAKVVGPVLGKNHGRWGTKHVLMPDGSCVNLVHDDQQP